MYHITPKRNVDSILTLGLLPGFTRGLSTRPCDIIFLTDNPGEILRTQAGKRWIETHEPVILKIDTESYRIERYQHDAYDPPRLSSLQFICKEHIEAKHINVVR